MLTLHAMLRLMIIEHAATKIICFARKQACEAEAVIHLVHTTNACKAILQSFLK